MSYATLSRKTSAAAGRDTSTALTPPPSSLRIGAPNDSFEQEADRVADAVMTGGRAKPSWSFSSMSMDAPLQRKCDCGGSGGECAECKEKETLQRKAAGAAQPGVAPPIVHEVLNSPGRPLDRATRNFFEPRFRQDLSQVRIHTDDRAAASAQAVRADAYTVGSHMVFGAGRYRPETDSGRFLVAHELTHVRQQRNPAGVKARAGEYESEATISSQRIERGEQPLVRLAAPTAIQRQVLPGAVPDLDAGLAESASPFMAATIGSITIDNFKTGDANLPSNSEDKLAHTVKSIKILLERYPTSTIRVIGHTDAVGEESDNRSLGQHRADTVQAALIGLDIPAAMIHTDSRGKSELLVQTKKGDYRNRRVQLLFEPSRLGQAAMSQKLTLSSQPPQQGQPGPIRGSVPSPFDPDYCLKNPNICFGHGNRSPILPKPPFQPFQQIPDDIPPHCMDVLSANAPYTSHGQSPGEGSDLSQIFAELYRRYRAYLPEKLACQAANSELSSAAGKAESRDNPNPADSLDKEMKERNPNGTWLGPVPIHEWKF